MSSTIKISIQRLRQITAMHLSKFTASFVVVALALISLGAINPTKIGEFQVPTYSSVWLFWMSVVIFGSPAAIHVTSTLSAKLRGVTETKIDSEAMKQTLFVVLGSLWSGAGALVLLSLSNVQLNLAKETASIVIATSWYIVCRIVLMHVRG